MSHKEKHTHHPWDHHQQYREANRRWSMALSSMGHSQTSAQSLQSIAGEGERKISFVLHEPDNESEGSSNTTLTMQGEENMMGKILKKKNYKLFLLMKFFISSILERSTTKASCNCSPVFIKTRHCH